MREKTVYDIMDTIKYGPTAMFWIYIYILLKPFMLGKCCKLHVYQLFSPNNIAQNLCKVLNDNYVYVHHLQLDEHTKI